MKIAEAITALAVCAIIGVLLCGMLWFASLWSPRQDDDRDSAELESMHPKEARL